MEDNNNGMVRFPEKDENDEFNWFRINNLEAPLLQDRIMMGSYCASHEVFVDGEWILVGWRKDDDWETEKMFYLIDGKWYESHIDQTDALMSKIAGSDTNYELEEIQEIIKKIGETNDTGKERDRAPE